MPPYPLADLLLARCLPAHQTETETETELSREALEKELEALHEKGRSSWPEVTVSAHDLIAYLAERIAPSKEATAGDGVVDEGDANGLPTSSLMTASDLRNTLGTVRIIDLYLACACARGDARAMALFDARYLCEVDRALHSSKLSEAIDETKQVLRRRFFVSEDGEPPRITNYSGRGDLKAWVRSAAVRAALRVKRRPKGEMDVESHVIRAVAAAGDDLELDYLKRRYLVEFEEALRDAFLALDVRDRNVTRYYYGKGLGIDAIGNLYRVHRSTVARWLNRITASLVETTRKRMMERLGANRAEVSSLVRMLESRIDMTMRAVVASIEVIDTKK